MKAIKKINFGTPSFSFGERQQRKGGTLETIGMKERTEGSIKSCYIMSGQDSNKELKVYLLACFGRNFKRMIFEGRTSSHQM
jgi:hypothetical protein